MERRDNAHIEALFKMASYPIFSGILSIGRPFHFYGKNPQNIDRVMDLASRSKLRHIKKIRWGQDPTKMIPPLKYAPANKILVVFYRKTQYVRGNRIGTVDGHNLVCHQIPGA